MTTKKNKTPPPTPRRRSEATPTTCPRCHNQTLTGWDDDTLGDKTTIDAGWLDPEAETRQWEAGHRTYELWSGRIAWRDQDSIRDRPANQTHVHPEHTCSTWPGLTQPTPEHGPPNWPGDPNTPPY